MRVDKARKLTDEKLEELEKEIEKVYKEAQSEITEKWNKYMESASFRISNLESKYKSALETGDKDLIKEAKEKLEKAKINATLTDKRYKDMIDDTTKRIASANQIALSYANGAMPQIYSINYNQVLGQAEQLGVKFDIVNESTVRTLVKQGEVTLPKKKIQIPKDKQWNKKQLNSSVLQGIVQGESMDKIAKRIMPIVDNNSQAAIRNARTMVTGAENQGRLDSYHELEEQGVIMKKVWMATKDDRTREWHLEMDGQEVDVDEPFIDGNGNELDYPGDPTAAPETVYNCRCSMRTKIIAIKGHKVEQEQQKEEIEENDKNAFTAYQRHKESFVPATTQKEAEEFISQYVDKNAFGATGVDYTGVNLEVQNVVNQTLSSLQETFNSDKFGGIIAPAGNTNLGKKINGATAAYSPVRNSFLLNRHSLSSVEVFDKAMKEEISTLEDVLKHPEKYNWSKMSTTLADTLHNSMESGRATIPKTIEEVIYHEYGHLLEKRVYKSDLWSEVQSEMGTYAQKISGYATTSKSDYIAESFCSYMKNEKIIDPNLETIFNDLWSE